MGQTIVFCRLSSSGMRCVTRWDEEGGKTRRGFVKGANLSGSEAAGNSFLRVFLRVLTISAVGSVSSGPLHF
ncbi:hypothetical protein SBA3_220020 [Candidatus Sulfopaludibacter sp. SbA3]|nr:hypothetical protein SBA3_220020 [Candidatus Sulfopaludibacter sp. SbA3]